MGGGGSIDRYSGGSGGIDGRGQEGGVWDDGNSLYPYRSLGHTEDVPMCRNLCISSCVNLPGRWQGMTCTPILTLANDMHADVFRSEGYWCLQLSLFIFRFFLAALGLRCCVRALSSSGERGLLFFAVRGLLIAVASLVAEHGLYAGRLSSCGARAQPLRSMWDLPGSGLEPVSPALAGRFLTTVPPGEPCNCL